MAACVATSRIHAPAVTRRAAQLRKSSFLSSLASPCTRKATRSSTSSLLHLVVRAGWNDVSFAPAKITSNKAITSSPVLNRLLVDVGPQAAKYTIAGQFVQVKVEEDGKAGFFAIASPPDANNAGVLELLVKASGDPAEAICASGDGTGVLVSDVMGKGFPVERVAGVDNVLIFCTGSGISPVKALIEVRFGAISWRRRLSAPCYIQSHPIPPSFSLSPSPGTCATQSGTLEASNRNVTLYYGAKNEQAMAYFDLLGEWEKAGVKVVPVFSETGMYVQDAFKKAGGVQDAGSSCAILCGQKEMAEAVKAIFAEAGVDEERVLTNF